MIKQEKRPHRVINKNNLNIHLKDVDKKTWYHTRNTCPNERFFACGQNNKSERGPQVLLPKLASTIMKLRDHFTVLEV